MDSEDSAQTPRAKKHRVSAAMPSQKFRAWTAAHFKRRQSRKRALSRTRMMYLGLGWPVFIIGAILTPFPLPVGVPMMIIGLFMLARGSRWVREKIIRLRRKWPQFSAKLNRLKSAMPAPIRRFLMRTDPHLYRKHHNKDL